MRKGDRTVIVNKNELINKIEENKKNHIEEYKKSVIAYKKEALKQLDILKDDISNGGLNIKLNLITPIDNSKNYDKIIEMFKWDVNEVVDLTQSEFKEYVQDETDFAFYAKSANQSYLG